jgi:hypothetical protein
MIKRLFALALCCCTLATALGAAPIAPLIADLNSPDYDARQTARLALRQALVDASPSDLPRLEGELLAAIGPDRDWAIRDWCLRLLELVGTPAAVAPLSRLLDESDPRIRDLARRALAAIPSPRAIDALKKAARVAPTSERGAYADALAYRGDPRAVKPLAAMLRDGSAAAALALGKFEQRSARSALQKAHRTADGELKTAIEYALLNVGLNNRRLAATLAYSGQTTAIQIAAFGQLADLDSRSAAELLHAVLAQPEDPRRRPLLRQAMTVKALRDGVVARLREFPEADRIVVLEAIADLNLTHYESSVLGLLGDSSETLNPVVFRTLGAVGTDASFQPLLDRYLANPRDRALTTALARLQAPSADRRLLTTAQGAGEVAERVAALRLLVLRNTEGVVDLLKSCIGPETASELRAEAFRGVEVVGDFESVRRMLQVVVSDDPLKRPAQASLKRLSANLGVPDALWHECYAPALAAAPDDDRRRDVLVIIDGISGPAAAGWLQQAVIEKQPLREGALDALRRWTDISGVDTWLAIAQHEHATAEEIAMAKESIVRILGSTRTTGLNNEKVERAATAMRAFADDPAFRRDVVALYKGELHWQVRVAINRLFPEFLSDPALATDVQELLDRARFD